MLAPRSRKLSLPSGPLRAAVIEELGSILRHAADSLEELSTSPDEAVHEYRKSLRRARSLVRLLRPSLSKSARRRLEVPLREAHHALSDDRDATIVEDTWRRISEETGLEIPAVEATLAARAPVHESGVAARRYFDDLIQHLESRLESDLDAGDLVEGLEATYRAAGRQLARVELVADPVHVHALRRRAKDLAYQLELLRPLGGKRVRKQRKRFAKLAEVLGRVTDLYRLREAVAVLAEPIDRETRVALDSTIESAIEARLGEALPLAKRRLRRRPGQWARRLKIK